MSIIPRDKIDVDSKEEVIGLMKTVEGIKISKMKDLKKLLMKDHVFARKVKAKVD